MQHFLSLADFSADQLNELLEMALFLKREHRSGGNRPVLAGKVLGMLFMKPSLRTRVSFEVGMLHLGGQALYLGPEEVGLGRRESIPDVARVLGGYVHGIMARVFEHDHLHQLAQWSPVPVINGLSDANHPCQAMADALTLLEHFGSLRGRSMAYVGDGNNVARSLLFLAARLGLDFRLACPPGYQLDAATLAQAAPLAEGSGAKITSGEDVQALVGGAEVVYTDTWTSMGQEAEAAERRRVFPPFQVNDALLKHAAPNAVVLHCLPAHRGEEITDAVADGPHSRIFQQAHNRLHAQKAILARLLRD
ncbi:MAG: ornithine carbamoyltransferase [Anaerolineae bacterium]|nr:ornithine carbamoyltransferase [Anaerolineae bacterium]